RGYYLSVVSVRVSSTSNGSEVNGFRVSVFLAASATGHTLPPLIVFAAQVVVNRFVKAGLIRTGPRDSGGSFRVPVVSASDAPLVCEK
ncbi:hypothetical protein L915_06701, partial [Phytophthora nicotianae]